MTAPNNKISAMRAYAAFFVLLAAWVCALWALHAALPQPAPVQVALVLLAGLHMYAAYTGLRESLTPPSEYEVVEWKNPCLAPAPSIPVEEPPTSPLETVVISETCNGFDVEIIYYMYGDFVEDWSVWINDLFLRCVNTGTLEEPVFLVGLDVEDEHCRNSDGYTLLDPVHLEIDVYGKYFLHTAAGDLLPRVLYISEGAQVVSETAPIVGIIPAYVDHMVRQREANKLQTHIDRGREVFKTSSD